MVKQLWTEKYRPKTLDEYIFKSDEHRDLIERWVNVDKIIPHLLLRGVRGTGKTSIALILKELLNVEDVDFMKLNASDDNNIETVRTKIKSFVSTFAYGDFKIVLLDEADGLSLAAQKTLKSMMEEYAEQARFILTCNNPNLILPELKSRCQELEYKALDKEQMLFRAAEILSLEKIKATPAALDGYLERCYPDFRKLLNTLDQNSIDGVLRSPDDVEEDFADYQLHIVDMLDSDSYGNVREVLASIVSDDQWDEVYRFLYDNLHELGKFKDFTLWSKGIIVIADHLYKHGHVADPEINGSAMFLRLGSL